MAVWVGSPNFHSQAGIAKRFIVLHWMVGTLSSTDARFKQATSQVSAHYGIEGTTVHQYVHEKDYAYACGNTDANAHGISIEHAGGYLANGKRVKPSTATHATSASLCADISTRWGLGKLTVGHNLFPHNHFYATECPGTLDLAWIASHANALIK